MAAILSRGRWANEVLHTDINAATTYVSQVSLKDMTSWQHESHKYKHFAFIFN